MRPNIKNIAVLTYGGDAPGMNACIRAVVRTGIYNGINMFGVLQGYQGLINNNINPMDARSVSNIIHLGGTILKTAFYENVYYSKRRHSRQNSSCNNCTRFISLL